MIMINQRDTTRAHQSMLSGRKGEPNGPALAELQNTRWSMQNRLTNQVENPTPFITFPTLN